jgi:ABC-type bacteriocin/lantibiotic exporters, contain an N-terminal double-glycine peptidase domain
MAKRLRTNIQFDAMDCGPSCVKTIAAFYGKNYNLDYLRNACSISKRGVSLLGISDCAEEIGLKTLAGEFTMNQLHTEATLPCILHFNQDHFVILAKTRKKMPFSSGSKYKVVDPVCGEVWYDEKEFKKKWCNSMYKGEDTGIALILEPTQDFYKQQSDKTNTKSLKFLFSYFLKYKKFFGQLIIGLLLGSLFQLIFPFLTQAIVDTGIANKNISFIYLILLAQMALIISRMSVEFIRRWILLHISTRINISLISDFFIKLMKLPMSYFDTKLTGDILQRIDDHERIESFLTYRTLDIIFSFFTLIIFGVVLWIYSFKIFLIFLSEVYFMLFGFCYFLKSVENLILNILK